MSARNRMLCKSTYCTNPVAPSIKDRTVAHCSDNCRVANAILAHFRDQRTASVRVYGNITPEGIANDLKRLWDKRTQ